MDLAVGYAVVDASTVRKRGKHNTGFGCSLDPHNPSCNAVKEGMQSWSGQGLPSATMQGAAAAVWNAAAGAAAAAFLDAQSLLGVPSTPVHPEPASSSMPVVGSTCNSPFTPPRADGAAFPLTELCGSYNTAAGLGSLSGSGCSLRAKAAMRISTSTSSTGSISPALSSSSTSCSSPSSFNSSSRTSSLAAGCSSASLFSGAVLHASPGFGTIVRHTSPGDFVPEGAPASQPRPTAAGAVRRADSSPSTRLLAAVRIANGRGSTASGCGSTPASPHPTAAAAAAGSLLGDALCDPLERIGFSAHTCKEKQD